MTFPPWPPAVVCLPLIRLKQPMWPMEPAFLAVVDRIMGLAQSSMTHSRAQRRMAMISSISQGMPAMWPQMMAECGR